MPQSARTALAAQGLPFRDGLHAASHALVNVLPLFLLCTSADLGTECDNPYDTRFRPERLLVYDKHPGGIGLAKQVERARFTSDCGTSLPNIATGPPGSLCRDQCVT